MCELISVDPETRRPELDPDNLLQDMIVEGEIRNQTPSPGTLLADLLHLLGIARPKVVILFSPATARKLSISEMNG